MPPPWGSRPSSSCQAGLPTAASPATLQHRGPCCPPPHPLTVPPFGVQEGYSPPGRGSGGALPCGRAPGCVRGATGLLRGRTAPTQVPCPEKPEGHVSMAGVSPLHAPRHCCPSPRGDTEVSAGFTAFPSIMGGGGAGHYHCNLLHGWRAAARLFCSCHCWTGLGPPAFAGRRAAGLSREFPLGRAPEAGAPVARVQGVYRRLVQLLVEPRRSLRQRCGIAAGRAPSSAAAGMGPGRRPGAGGNAAAGKPVLFGEPSHTPRVPLSLSHSHIAAAPARATKLPVGITGGTGTCVPPPLTAALGACRE